MKILIAYDGSECSDAAIVDLRRAGLPGDAQAIVLTAAEVSPQVAAVPYGALIGGPEAFCPDGIDRKASGVDPLREAQGLAAQAAGRLAADFPGWSIATETWIDAAAAAIIRKAHGWKADLVVVGSHGRSGISRFVLGSVSQKVVQYVECSMRISRHRLHAQNRSIRLLIGADGSNNSKSAVKAVAARNWPKGTEARAVGVLDSRIALAAAGTPEGIIPVDTEEEFRRRMSQAVRDAAAELAKSGLIASHQVLSGKPDEVLLDKAEEWGADCLFVGATYLNRLEQFMHGNVSAAVGSQARCSVEIVRCCS